MLENLENLLTQISWPWLPHPQEEPGVKHHPDQKKICREEHHWLPHSPVLLS
jgi:hypothetical protein